MRKLTREQEAIELGRIWMKKSFDEVHDEKHVTMVEKHALEVFHEMQKRKEFLDDIDENLVLLAVWWHDCYKATLCQETWDSVMNEGERSAEIAENELSSYLTKDRLDKVLTAIRYHNKPYFYMPKRRKLTKLGQILIEADCLDGYRKNRNPNSKNRPSLGDMFRGFVISSLVYWGLVVFAETKYTRNNLWNIALRRF